MDPDILELTVPNLRDRIDAFNYRLNKAQKDRNYMQLEKDMVNRFYDITKGEVKQIEAELLNMDRQMDKMEREHRELQLHNEDEVKMLRMGFDKNLGRMR